jgi:hypothetical protein
MFNSMTFMDHAYLPKNKVKKQDIVYFEDLAEIIRLEFNENLVSCSCFYLYAFFNDTVNS